ncbi:Uncharacterized protein FWK35_00012261 [Aphis craccivora]|uniref:FP protein C-terminal domain-containing protein n=1 Tax=Aphis craccivora TaxID=307492 RepID=A0A6G0YBW7_APHCR|nr:Uncharacterized protein FWK35_00012261 [Aphis craccivora]
MPLCNSCSVNIVSALSVTCTDCDLTWHTKCQKLSKEDVGYLKESDNIWRCGSCSNAKRASLRLDSTVNSDTFQKFKEDTCINFNNLNAEFNVIDKIITENNILKTHIIQLENKIELMERRQISNDIIIDGIPENKTEDCTNLVQQICKELNSNINVSMINDCHRIGFNHNNARPRRIIVKFINHQDKINTLKARQIKRNFSTKDIGIQPDMPIYIRENITTKGSKLFKEARDLKKSLHFQFVWTKNGLVFLRKNETDKIIRVDNEEVISNLKSQYDHLNSTNLNSTLLSDNNVAINTINCTFDKLNNTIYLQNSINIFTMNICSIKKHFDELCINLDNMNTKFDVIILTEAWLGLGYSTHTTLNNKNQNDGIVIYLKDTLTDVSIIEFNTSALTTLEISFELSKTAFVIYPTYRSPNGIIDIALEELNDIILSDFNIDILKPSKTKEDYLMLMAQLGFIPVIENITRPASNTCIDHIFVKTKSLDHIKPIIIKSNITDHYPKIISVGNILDNRHNKPNPLKILITDEAKLTDLIQNFEWSEMYDIDTNRTAHYFTEKITSLKKQASSEISFNSKNKKIKPWATTALINSIRHRDHLHLQVRKYPLKLKLKDFYLKFRNKLTYLIKETKTKYYKKEIKKSGNDTKYKWQLINDIISRNNKSINLDELLNNIKANTEPNDRKPVSILARGLRPPTSPPNQALILADNFNDYFINVATDLVTQLNNDANVNNLSNIYRSNNTIMPNNSPLNKFELITHEDILEATSKLKNGASPGIDNISSN